ncbi:MAG: efflux RND transporter periplasmic adaptor subunit, partial [Chthoniobacteraceae bacterium]
TASVESAEAAIKNAELQLEYTEIRAPLEGRAGKFLVYPGHIVEANQTDLVVIHQVQPIEVSFAVAERHLPEIRKESADGKLAVKVATDANTPATAEGELSFVDNAVKPASGTIDLKATFRNDPVVLWPGQFVDVEMVLSLQKAALVAPARAVQSSQNGSFVFVIKPDETVEARDVVLARTVGEVAVLSQGVQPGERIVLDGHAQLTPGSKVQVKTGLAPTSPAKANPKLTMAR